jgi:hypothetical protein
VSTREVASLERLLGELVDDAGVFPPRDLGMAEALREHREHRTARYSWLLGRFLVPASRLAELQANLPDGDRLRVGVVVDTGAPGVADAVAAACEDRRLELAAVEVPLAPVMEQSAAAHRALQELARLPDGVPAFVELPRVYGWRDALSLIAARRRGAKLRTGGLVASAFPTDLEVAIFIHACVEERVPFKLTAGLHHAIRHVDEATGFEHHGFLNALVATAQAVLGGSVSQLADVLAMRDASAVLDRFVSAGERTIESARRHFVAFGSCSVADPVADLVKLGLIEPA